MIYDLLSAIKLLHLYINYLRQYNAIDLLFLCSVGVHVLVQDVNEYPPEWGQSTVRVEIEEGQLLDRLIQVEATDKDCSAKYGDICSYEILQSDHQPFTISRDGRCYFLILMYLPILFFELSPPSRITTTWPYPP